MRRTVWLITLLLLARPLFGAATTAPNSQIQTLIENLGDPDPSTRQHASEKLAAIGYSARPALVLAARSASPQIASRAADVLMKLPWWVLGDPPDVRDVLMKYGGLDNDGRKQAIQDLAILPGSEPALLRLVQDEPSDTVAWQAAEMLRLIESAPTTAALRRWDLTDARVQIVALAARAFLPVDHAKGIALFHRAVEQDAQDDGSDDASLDFAYSVLISDALDGGDFKTALHLQRLRARRAATGGDASAAVFELMAFYADHRLSDALADELNDDVADYSSYLGRPEVMHALARIENVRNDGSTLLKDAIGYSAMASSLSSAESHVRVAHVLTERAWDGEARRELYAVLAMPAAAGDANTIAAQFSAQMMLARSDEVIEDHLAVADHLEEAMRSYEKFGASLDADLTEIKNQIAWHRLHALRTSGDKRAADKILRQLMELPSPDSDVAIEVVNALKAEDRQDEAKAYFDKAYRLQDTRLSLRLGAAEALNNLAWLCSRSGEQANDAVAMAARAMALEPENYAYIDTAASASFAAGDPAKAAEFEQRALNMRPCDMFMQRQLEIFQKAKLNGK